MSEGASGSPDEVEARIRRERIELLLAEVATEAERNAARARSWRRRHWTLIGAATVAPPLSAWLSGTAPRWAVALLGFAATALPLLVALGRTGERVRRLEEAEVACAALASEARHLRIRAQSRDAAHLREVDEAVDRLQRRLDEVRRGLLVAPAEVTRIEGQHGSGG